MIRITIPGRPAPNVRLTRGEIRAQSPRAVRYLEFLHFVQWTVKLAMRAQRPLTGPIAVRVVIRITGSAMSRRNRPYDVSNVEKVVIDGLKGHAFADDWWVVSSSVTLVDNAEENVVIVEAWEVGEEVSA